MTGVLVMMLVAAASLIGLQLYCDYKQSFEEPEEFKAKPKKITRPKPKAAKPVVKVSIKKRK